MPFLDHNEARLYFEDSGGDGLPILLTHGFGASTGMWSGQVETFSLDYRFICWDMRGHGRTECPEDVKHFSQALTVADMAALLQHLKIDQAVIGGHSLGGFMSLAFHVSHPAKVRALVLQGCGPGYRKDDARATWNGRAENRARTLEQGGLAALGGASEVGQSVQGTAQGLAHAARGILSQVDARVIDSLPHIKVPTLVVIGENDTAYLTGSHYMASRIPGALEVIVPDAAHGVNIDQPDVVNAALVDFLSGL